jgi:hypothetical protein
LYNEQVNSLAIEKFERQSGDLPFLEAQVVAKIMSFRNNLLVYKSLVESTARRNEGALNLKLVSLQAENTALEHQIR